MQPCGKPGHLKKDCWSFKGKGGGGKAVSEVEGVDGFWEMSAVNQVKTGNRYKVFEDDTESESEDEDETINVNPGDDSEEFMTA